MPETHHRSGSRTLAALLTLLALTASLTVTAVPAQALATTIRPARASYAAAIEPLAAYQPQTTCSPVARPGVASLAARLLSAFPTTRSLGIVRACSVGGRSEHKEGRAFDWGVDARSAADRARVATFLTWLLKTDKYGNSYAMARRLGIQYVVWNRHIWGSYAAASGWRKYTGDSPHTDHVHISFTWAGAREQTSFWTGKVGNVGSAPPPGSPIPSVPSDPLHPPVVTTPKPVATPTPTPTPTPVTTLPPPRPRPLPAVELPPGPALVDEALSLPATSEGVLTTGALTAGQAYLVEASGSYRYGTRASQAADAECSRTPTDGTWRRDRSVYAGDPTSNHLDLYVDGVDLQSLPDVDTGLGCDTRTHTYRWTYRPARTGRVTFARWDPTTSSDDTGSLSLRVVAVTPRDDMTWQVPADAGAGVSSPAALQGGATYLVTVTGTVAEGGGVTADAGCSASATDPVWRATGTLLVDRVAQPLQAVTDPELDGCDTTGHAYRIAVTPTSTRTMNIRVGDPAWTDDTGALTVTATRVRPVVGTETMPVDTARPAVATARTYLAGQPLKITATGTYVFGAGVTADAECTATTADPVWRSTRSTLVSAGHYLGDLTVDGTLPDWTPTAGSSCSTTTHGYTLTYTPSATRPLTLGVADLDLADNAGTVTVTISPAG